MTDDLGYFPIPKITCETWDGRNIRLVDSFTFFRPARLGGAAVTFPASQTSDGPSVPHALAILGLNHEGPAWPAGVGHDCCYRGPVLVNGVSTLMSKNQADLLFYEMLLACGVAELQAREFYEGVVAFGQRAFDEDRAKLAADEGRRHDVAG